MTFKDKVIKYLEDFIDDKFCDYATGRDIRVFVLPHIKSMQDDPVSEDVVSAANHAWLKAKDTESYADTFTDGFKAGAQWKKEQMMKEMPKWKDNWLGHTKKPCIADEIPGRNGKQLCVAGKCISIDDLWTKLFKED